MAGRRPFHDLASVLDLADTIWWELESQDWLEAFRAHPKIGARGTTEWSREEQSGALGASPETLAALAKANRAYEERFGYIFIVCASGKTAAEMLERLEERLENTPEQEILVAAEEQRRILRLRLEKLVNVARASRP